MCNSLAITTVDKQSRYIRKFNNLTSNNSLQPGSGRWPENSRSRLKWLVVESMQLLLSAEAVKKLCKSSAFWNRKTLVNNFVISRIDYCNSLLAAAPPYLLNRLQRVMNEAARMLCRCSRGDHVNGIMKERPHWLKIQRIQFKLCLLVYKSLHGKAPAYLSNLVNQVDTIDARRRLCSATDSDLIIPRTHTNFGKHAFATVGPIAGKSLSISVRSVTNIVSLKKKTENSPFQLVWFRVYISSFSFISLWLS